MKQIKNLNSLLLVSVLLTWQIFSACLLAQKKPDSINLRLSTYLSNYQRNKLIPGISAGVALNDSIIWLDAYGLADVENNSPASIHTHFRIASISKSITAVAIMQLVENGVVKLDDDARKYIPYFPKKKWKFTIRQLLNHTSGIRNYYKNEFDDTKHYSTIKEAVSIVSKDSLMFMPGTKYQYTTLGYNLLGAIIENVSGLSYVEYLKRNIFEPSQMNDTYLDYQSKIIFNKARLYIRNKYRILENAPLADLSNKYPGGGLISTAEDLLKFSIALLEGKFIKPETLDTMLVPVRLKNGTRINYGLGFTLGTDAFGRKYFSHEGYLGTSLLVIYPDNKLASVDLLNVRDRNNGTCALDLAALTMNDSIPFPKALLTDKLMEVFLTNGIDSVVSSLKEIVNDSSTFYDVSLNEIASFGYDLLNINKNSGALKYFKFIISQFPQKSKPYIGLADSYFRDGNLGLALRNYRLAFKLEPTNAYALSMIKKLTKIK
jgi:serine beta-lactamase-like protein LACTB, mitochondrial